MISFIAWAARERAQSLAEFALLLPVLGLLVLGVIDFGRAYYLSIEVNNAAYAGALYGASNSSDTAGMQAAALADAADVPGMTATPSFGCECSDGSGINPTCASPPGCSPPATTLVNYVLVTTSATYNTMFPWPGIPSQFTLTGSAKLRASQ
jgi:Flp pilus assembly protein TadG